MYLTFKALHIISFVAWFAGLFYIYRLFVYHVANKSDESLSKVFVVMERRLLKAIMMPAAVATIAFGVGMLMINPGWLQNGWIWTKLALILGLLVYHGSAIHVQRRFSEGSYVLTEKACRILNEVPTLILLGVVFLAVLKPF